MGCIDQAHDRDVWQAAVNATVNLRFPYYAINFLTE